MTGNATSCQFFLSHVGLNVDIQLIEKKKNYLRAGCRENPTQRPIWMQLHLTTDI